jgi:lipoate-protein ligase A
MKTLAIDDYCQSGYVNMAVDLCSMRMVQEGAADIIFRTYTWDPHCLSIGRFQKPDREADVKRLLEDGFHIVRRPTGGRAVWHGHELTYSVVARTDHPLVSGTISESLGKVAALLTDGLKVSGVPAVLNARSRELSETGREYNPCFTSHGRSEIMTPDGKKLVGSAQARSHGVFIEHGSIIFTNQQIMAVDYLPREASSSLKEKMRELLLKGVGTVLKYVPGLTTETLADNLHRQFSVHCGETPSETFSHDLPYLEETIAERRQIIESY